ncbi:fructose 1,6-bisphosphatase [Phreatobacter stygius]|uniref:Fructose-1,6-bisphosphate aldolase/phosphatase n=1 Tax=Phreatobacter stygius TaxID=1940610 RepID=A0A4D7B9T8_9HYPH|nr:fructose 1,6-bisphosphatase [Phreatobacter stygius]QCI67615.1 fructose 1,6-bisphosphatase [Phreatobacter stygius]
MRTTISVIKADVGSIGGHTMPSARMLDSVRSAVSEAIARDLMVDGFVCHTGDDIAIVMSHRHGKGHPDIHGFAWDAFLGATGIAKMYGLYGAGQDLLVDAPSGNLRGAGPGVAEIEFDLLQAKHRPAESFMVLAADKCGPGAYNLPLFLAFADPMYCAGLMLPQMIEGFRFRIIDMDNTAGDSIIELDAPEDAYHIAALLRDNERFGIDAIISRSYGEQAAAVSAQRLHSIAGKYTGKDDPVALIRNQGIFPAPEELLSPFVKAHYVGGDARGSHVMPLMPVPLNTAVTGAYCLPIVSCIGFSMEGSGRFTDAHTDFFANPAWDEVRRRAQQKAIEMRSQGWSGAAMLPYSELEYGGFRDTVGNLVKRFQIETGPDGGGAEPGSAVVHAAR